MSGARVRVIPFRALLGTIRPVDIDPAYLPFLFFIAALLYSSVGHAGASGYLAAMALAGMAPDMMKPAALCMNVVVATLTTFRFYKAGFFSPALLWPFAVTAVPLAYLGGLVPASIPLFKPIVGVVLWIAAIRLMMNDRNGRPGRSEREPDRADRGSAGVGVRTPAPADHTAVARTPRLPLALLVGAAIGFLSGLTGTGGGIFLSPILILAGWANPRVAGGVSAAFILLNSISGLGGVATAGFRVPDELPLWVAVVFIGALAGTQLGTRQLAPLWLKRLLGVVLLIAGFKFVYPVVVGAFRAA